MTGRYIDDCIKGKDWKSVAEMILDYGYRSYDFEGEDEALVEMFEVVIEVAREYERDRIAKKIGSAFTSVASNILED